jgi:hypothetical protein
MGKMKEKFIDEINANAAHISFDTVDEHKYLDDEYHYHKYKKASIEKIISRICEIEYYLTSKTINDRDHKPTTGDEDQHLRDELNMLRNLKDDYDEELFQIITQTGSY